ncbi:MAG: L,D-transpeptidase [Pseudomonadota bacterium]|nr:L,D-transpeptidase [Pseudomonadota bacterium]
MMLFLLFVSFGHADEPERGFFARLFGPPPVEKDDDTGVLAKLPPEVAEGVAIQTWLARTPFQPGSIDGSPGSNTWQALRAFQRAERLSVTGEPDRKTRKRLRKAALGKPRSVLRRHVVTAEDVAGPYEKLPDGIYAASEAPCMCYESALEEVAERYFVAPGLVAALNPTVDLARLEAGDEIVLPDARPIRALDGKVARIQVNVTDRTLTAFDEQGTVLRQYPTVIGETFAQYKGQMTVARVARNPDYTLDPASWEEIPDTLPKVVIPPGPNSPVGVVWMGLSKDGYGIHGTSQPETIGHTESHGCVRLTNWSASELAGFVEPGATTVDFVGVPPS